MATNDEQIVLHDVRGLGGQFTLLDGLDHEGNVWVYHRLGGNHVCHLCGEPVTDGWTRFDDGSVVCAKHINVTGKV